MWTVVIWGSLASYAATARDLDDCRQIILRSLSTVGQIEKAYCVSAANPNDRIDFKALLAK